MGNQRSGRPKSAEFSLMTDEQLIEYCSRLYAKNGLASLTFDALKRERGLYFYLYKRGLTQAVVLERLGVTDAFAEYKATRPLIRAGKTRQRWSWNNIVERASAIKKELGFLPPAG